MTENGFEVRMTVCVCVCVGGCVCRFECQIEGRREREQGWYKEVEREPLGLRVTEKRSKDWKPLK